MPLDVGLCYEERFKSVVGCCERKLGTRVPLPPAPLLLSPQLLPYAG